MNRFARLIPACLAIASLIGGASRASPDAAGILRKSYAAESQARYIGRLTTELACGAGRSAKADVTIQRSGGMSRMEYVTGPSAGTVIIDDGRSMTRLDASSRTAYISETPDAPEQLDLLLSNYQPVLAGDAKIAGRQCYVVKLTPKCACNPSEKLWIDKVSSVALKTEKYGSDGKITSSTEYRSVDYSARPAASAFRVPSGWKTVKLAGASAVGLEAVRKAVGFTPKKPGYVPNGYRFDDYYVRGTPRCTLFAGLRYTNGMNTISVFERKGGCFGPGFGRGRGRGRGAQCGRGGCPWTGPGCHLLVNNPQARIVHTTVGDLTVLVVGDIALTELQKMAGSFK